MDLYQCYSCFHYELKDITSPQPNSNNQEVCEINFKFCAHINLCDWTSHDDSGLQLTRLYDEVVIEYIVCVSRNQFLFTDETRILMQEELTNLRLSSDELQELIEYAMKKASDLFCSDNGSVLGYEVVVLNFDVFVEHDHVFPVINDSCCMVPAAVSSVKKLKRVAAPAPAVSCGRRSSMEETTSCSICLEEFSGGSGEALLCMPCLHVFHSNCIEKWLMTSHYCPLCRFEMPMEEMDTERDFEISI